MNQATRNITKETFPVFKKLIEEVIVKATNKPAAGNPAIGEVFSKKDNRLIKQIPESKAKEIIIKITSETYENDNRGRRLQTLINAALNDDRTVNTRLYTLDLLAGYVLNNGTGQFAEKATDTGTLNWQFFIEKNKHLIADNIPNTKEPATKDDDTSEVSLPVKEIEEKNDQTKPLVEQAIIHLQQEPEGLSANTSIRPIAQIKKRHQTFSKAGMYGGACAGFFGVLTIVLIRYVSNGTIPLIPTGYENISKDAFFNQLFPVIFLFQILGGGLLGWLCCKNALKRMNFLRNSLLFLLSFVILLLLRQSTVRNAWRSAGEFTGIDKNGKSVIMTGGPLGEPDFEALAVGFMGAVALVALSACFRRILPNIPTGKKALGIILFTIISGFVAWCAVYFLFVLLTHFRIIKEHDFLISKTVFHFVFPHPERAFLIIILLAIYAYCIIASIQYHCKEQAKNSL